MSTQTRKCEPFGASGCRARDHGLELAPDDAVVVLAAGVARDVPAARPAAPRGRRRAPTSRTGGSSRGAAAPPRPARGTPSRRAGPSRRVPDASQVTGREAARTPAAAKPLGRARRAPPRRERAAGSAGRGGGGRRGARATSGAGHTRESSNVLAYDPSGHASRVATCHSLHPVIYLRRPPRRGRVGSLATSSCARSSPAIAWADRRRGGALAALGEGPRPGAASAGASRPGSSRSPSALVVLLPAVLLGAAILNQAVGAATAHRAPAERRARPLLERRPRDSRRRARDGLGAGERPASRPRTFRPRRSSVARTASSRLAAAGGSAVLSFLDILVTFLLTLFLLFFLLRDGRDMVRALSTWSRSRRTERRRSSRSLGSMLQSIFRGSLLCALIQGATGGSVGRSRACRRRSSRGPRWRVLSLLPIGGTAIVWGPGARRPARQGRHGGGDLPAIWGVVVVVHARGQRPQADADRQKGGELSTLVVFLGVFGGLGASASSASSSGRWSSPSG